MNQISPDEIKHLERISDIIVANTLLQLSFKVKNTILDEINTFIHGSSEEPSVVVTIKESKT